MENTLSQNKEAMVDNDVFDKSILNQPLVEIQELSQAQFELEKLRISIGAEREIVRNESKREKEKARNEAEIVKSRIKQETRFHEIEEKTIK